MRKNKNKFGCECYILTNFFAQEHKLSIVPYDMKFPKVGCITIVDQAFFFSKTRNIIQTKD